MTESLTILLGVVWIAAVASPPAAFAQSARADTSRFRLEIGASTDLSNEIFYEDEVDTTFLKTHLVSSPEAQISGVSRIALLGTRGARAFGYRIQNDVSLGTLVQSDVLELHGETLPAGSTRYDVLSRTMYRHDQSFDRDLTEGRADGYGRVRQPLGDVTRAELGGRWDFGRSGGPSATLIPDRNAGGGWIALERLPLVGTELRAGYGLMARAYPDSVVRDHYEHSWELHVRQDLPGLVILDLESVGQRRTPIYTAPNSRDAYVSTESSAELRWRPVERLEARARFDGEWLRYDHPDTLIYFDYDLMRASVTLRYEWPVAVEVGPRFQWLRSPLEPAEGYDETAGAFEFEWLGLGHWWSFNPAFGWRNYALGPNGDPFTDVGLHSSYWFLEGSAFAEQSLGRAVRLRLAGSARDEHHQDPSQNARSLYFSLDIRRLF